MCEITDHSPYPEVKLICSNMIHFVYSFQATTYSTCKPEEPETETISYVIQPQPDIEETYPQRKSKLQHSSQNPWTGTWSDDQESLALFIFFSKRFLTDAPIVLIELQQYYNNMLIRIRFGFKWSGLKWLSVIASGREKSSNPFTNGNKCEGWSIFL